MLSNFVWKSRHKSSWNIFTNRENLNYQQEFNYQEFTILITSDSVSNNKEQLKNKSFDEFKTELHLHFRANFEICEIGTRSKNFQTGHEFWAVYSRVSYWMDLNDWIKK